MKTLKAFVIGMGILLVLGFGLVGYGVVRNLHRLPAAAPSAGDAAIAVPLAGSSSAGHAPFALDLPVPAGARLQEMLPLGGRLLLRLSGGEGGERILVIDPQSGQLTGSIALVGAKPAAATTAAAPGQIPRRDPPAH